MAAFGDKLAWSDTLTGALDQLFGGNAGANAGDDNGPPPTDPGTEPPSDAEALAAALADMQKAFDDGKAALEKGDFAAYGAAQDRLQAALERAVAAQPDGGSVTVNPTPSSTATS